MSEQNEEDEMALAMPIPVPPRAPPRLTASLVKVPVLNILNVMQLDCMVGDHLVAETTLAEKKLRLTIKVSSNTNTSIQVSHAVTDAQYDEWQLFGNYVASKLRAVHERDPAKAAELERRLMRVALNGVSEMVERFEDDVIDLDRDQRRNPLIVNNGGLRMLGRLNAGAHNILRRRFN